MVNSIYLIAGQSNAELIDRVASGLPATSHSGASIQRVTGVYSGGAPLTFGVSKQDWHVQSELTEALISRLRSELTTDPDAHLSGILWIQGEADTHAIGRAEQYGSRLTSTVNEVLDALADFGSRIAGCRFVVLALAKDAPISQQRPNWEVIRQQQLQLDHPNISVIDPTSLSFAGTRDRMFMSDGLHYREAARVELLQRMLQELPNTISGDASRNLMLGTIEVDFIFGFGGSDRIHGGKSGDKIEGMSGFDFLFGGTGNDTIFGGSGNDALFGGGGSDSLIGGSGFDRLYGDKGSDVFVFDETESFGSVDGQHDVILDYERAVDKIDLSPIDAVISSPGDDAFVFIGLRQFTGKDGELRVQKISDSLLVVADRDGNGIGDFFLTVIGADFIRQSDIIL